MTETNPSNVISYAGNPPQIVYSVPLYFEKNSDIIVTLRDVSGTESNWIEGTHYALVGAMDPSNASLTVDIDPVDYTPQAGEKLFIRRVQPLTQETAYPEGGEFPARAHEDALDRLTRTAQQLREELDRAAVLPATSPVKMPGLPEPVADKILGWNSTATKIENKNPGGGSGEANTASNTGTAGTGIFKQKAGVDLEFYKLNPITAALTITLNGTDKIDLAIANAVAAGNAGLMTGADKSKLDGIEASATADQTNAEIKTAYEANANTNEFSDAEQTKLDGIAAGADVSPVATVFGRSGTVVAVAGDYDNLALNMQDKVLTRPEVKDYSLTTNAKGNQATTVAADFTLGNVTTATLTGNVTVTVANWPATGKRGRMEIHLTQDATGSRTVTAWPVDKWVGGSAPTLGTANGDVDIIVITSDDAGTTRIGAHVGTAS